MIFRRPELFFQQHLRLVEHLQRSRSPVARVARVFVRFRLQRLSVRTGISVPPGVFGAGLSIAHYGSIVVNSKAKVGKYCRIHSATNIGVANGQTPVIGDFVYIGPGAVIYGGVHIGSFAVIGANAVVNKDVPAGCTVAGAPARVISNSSSRSIMPEWYSKFGLYGDVHEK
ncbi:serine O-acetyltransferase [Rhodococcoides fascians]|uniref:serine O-acetyltransferase n=1 Tax=Rhodococcoides fascians TaxID=1828 RepID=UPI00353038C0